MAKLIYTDLDLSGGRIINLADPVQNGDVATKRYVDQAVQTASGGANPHHQEFTVDDWVVDSSTGLYTLTITHNKGVSPVLCIVAKKNDDGVSYSQVEVEVIFVDTNNLKLVSRTNFEGSVRVL